MKKNMLLLIDNYDSFVYNLARYFTELGVECCVKRNDALTLREITALDPAHIVISPGPCAPAQAGISLAVITRFAREIPILGVCLGHQAIAQACGAQITRAQYPLHGKATLIQHTSENIFTGLPNPLLAGRYHSLIVSEENFPKELIVTARSVEGEVMALAHRQHPVFGVQFHPESILTEGGYALLENFLAV
jgi:para-aminobenzoate synthetase component 2